MDNLSTIECSIGSLLLLENNTHYVNTKQNSSSCRINVTALKYSCNLCPPPPLPSVYYSLQKGVSRGLNVHTSVQRLPCLFGATCIEKNIAANSNFWGYPDSNHPPSISMLVQYIYCQSPTLKSKDYNSWCGKRTGSCVESA